MKVPSAAIVTLPLCAVDVVVACTAIPPAGASLARTEPVRAMKGVAGELVAPAVTTACVLLTRFEYESLTAFGLMAFESDCEPVQLDAVSVAVTVNVNVPVAVGVPLIAPFEASVRPVGNVPDV